MFYLEPRPRRAYNSPRRPQSAFEYNPDGTSTPSDSCQDTKMDFSHTGASPPPPFQQSQPFMDAQLDIFEWHAQYQSCLRYFLDQAQYQSPIQAVAAFVNIQLPFQRSSQPVLSSKLATSPPLPTAGPSGAIPDPLRGPGGGGGGGGATASTPGSATSVPGSLMPQQPLAAVSLVPYIRRLVATGFDFPAVLHGFFGDDWAAGVGRLHEAERRNYLFAAKSASWLKVKAAYDAADSEQTIPFLQPLRDASEKEIQCAEAGWSEWLAMQDWMLGPRAPIGGVGSEGRGGGGGAGGGGGGGGGAAGLHGGVSVKREEQ